MLMTMNSAGKYKFKKTLVTRMTTDEEGIWDMYSEALDLHVYGDSMEECMDGLEEELEDWVYMFMIHPKSDFSPSTVETFERLNDYVDVKEIQNNIKDSLTDENGNPIAVVAFPQHSDYRK